MVEVEVRGDEMRGVNCRIFEEREKSKRKRTSERSEKKKKKSTSDKREERKEKEKRASEKRK